MIRSCEGLGEVLGVEDLAKLDQCTFAERRRLTHSTASSIEATSQIEKPATNSFVSANGPSITVVLPAASKATRLPLLLGWRPSLASTTPASASCRSAVPCVSERAQSGMSGRRGRRRREHRVT